MKVRFEISVQKWWDMYF